MSLTQTSRPHFHKVNAELKRLVRANWNNSSVLREVYAELGFRDKMRAAHLRALVAKRLKELPEQPPFKPLKLPWKLLPPGEHLFPRILAHFERLARHSRHAAYDFDRLRQINSLRPDSVYLGTDEFKGYAVFYFNNSSTAVLECPVSGNAIYIIKGNWQRLSQLSKSELLSQFPRQVKRVIHNGWWFYRLKSLLKT